LCIFALLAELELFVEDGQLPFFPETPAGCDDTGGVIEDAVVSRGTGLG
jgi:hypothetical protein